jgi:hypothetical protein
LPPRKPYVGAALQSCAAASSGFQEFERPFGRVEWF